MRSKIITVPMVLSLVAIGLTGCGADTDEKTVTGQTPHETEGKSIVLTTFTVLQDMAEDVAGDHLDVRSITKPDTEIHDYQPTPSDLKSTKDAKLTLNNGLGLEHRFEKFTADLDAKTANVSEGVKPIPIAEGDYEGKPDPHTWMSPKGGALYVHNIAKAFYNLDAASCNDYKANAGEYAVNIGRVGEDVDTTLSNSDPEQRTLVSCEGAFSYLTHDYSPDEKYLRGVSARGTLTPSHVTETENYVKESKVPAVFCRSTVGEKMKPIVGFTGVKFGDELYVDSLSGADDDVPTYLDLLEYGTKLITDGSTDE